MQQVLIGGIFVFCVLFLLGILSIYICLLCFHYKLNGNSGFDEEYDIGDDDGLTAAKGLDSKVIQTFPVFVYSDVKNHKKEINAKGTLLDCAVCLGEYEDGDFLRLLPKCHHVFHRECTDRWFVSHSTCPVCRADLNMVVSDSAKSTTDDFAINVIEDDANYSETNPSQSRLGVEGIRVLDPERRQGRRHIIFERHNQNFNFRY